MQLSKELDYYRGEYFKKLGIRYRFDDIAGKSEAMLRVKEMARKVAWSDSTVFIGGESGTGKEMFAHAIHFESPRRGKPFIKVNCAANPESLVESILFGYEEGAFTGAFPGGRKGKFLLAEGGTIFLDEIGELPLTMQAKLLRVLQEKEVEPVGSAHPVPINVRVLAASNRDLEEMVREKKAVPVGFILQAPCDFLTDSPVAQAERRHPGPGTDPAQGFIGGSGDLRKPDHAGSHGMPVEL